MLTPEQFKAIEIAVDIAYEDTPSDDAERLQLEDQARSGLNYLRAAADAPHPEGKRWRILTRTHKAPSVLMCAKGMMAVDPHGKIVLMPEIDYDRVYTRLLALEVLALKYGDRTAEIDDLLREADAEAKAQNAVYLPSKDDAQPEAPNGTTGQDVDGRSDGSQEDEGSHSGGDLPGEVQPLGAGDVAGEEAPSGEGQAPREPAVASDGVAAGSVLPDAGQG